MDRKKARRECPWCGGAGGEATDSRGAAIACEKCAAKEADFISSVERGLAFALAASSADVVERLGAAYTDLVMIYKPAGASEIAPWLAVPRARSVKSDDTVLLDQLWKAECSASAWEDPSYFKSYEDLRVHEEMLRDERRTYAYGDAFIGLGESQWIDNKTVLDVGGGSGILSIFAARAGAKKVFCVEASDMAQHAARLVKENQVDDTVSVIQGRVEDVSLGDGDVRVDAIVSEWMGYGLLYESMLDSVVSARDRFLAPGGLMLPSQARLIVAGFTQEDSSDILQSADQFWREDVHYMYGVNMASLAAPAVATIAAECEVASVMPEQVLTTEATIANIDLATVTHDDLKAIGGEFELTGMMRAALHGFIIWFDVQFPDEAGSVILSTSPYLQCALLWPYPHR